MDDIIIIKNNFEEEVLASDIPVFVDFWAEWCAPCRMVAPIFEELAEEYAGRIKFCKLNIDEEERLAADNEVSSIPSLLFFRNGVEADRIIGARPIDDFVEFLDRNLQGEENK